MSFGAFVPSGQSRSAISGDANDYFGKGLSGGACSAVRPSEQARRYRFDENVIVGNVAFYGATSGQRAL